jgi:hydrogenase maturation protease
MAPRTLIAGFGNVLRGDDGFGVEVVRQLQAAGLPGPDVELLDVGTGGIRLAQELLGHYDRLIVVDAVAGSGPPGRVHVRAVESVEAAGEIDLHLAIPSRALALAKALGALPREIFFVGCVPGEVNELTMELSPPVRHAVETAVHRIHELLGVGDWTRSLLLRADPVEALQLRDEILQVMYWLRGEGLGESVTADELRRFLVAPPEKLAAEIHRLEAAGYVERPDEAGPYRLSPLGITEGGRRFREEFAPFLGRESHNQCGDPDCECQTSGEACARLGERSG